MNTLENNRLIAEFMGDTFITDMYGNVKEDLSTLQYHNDWNWLMLVVEKIEDMKFYTNYDMCITGKNDNEIMNFFRIYQGGYLGNIVGFGKSISKIEAVYNAVTEFIKWYNQNN